MCPQDEIKKLKAAKILCATWPDAVIWINSSENPSDTEPWIGIFNVEPSAKHLFIFEYILFENDIPLGSDYHGFMARKPETEKYYLEAVEQMKERNKNGED